MKAREIAKITGGKLLRGNAEREIDPSKILTDSRTIKKGEFFIALSGPSFNGNRFVGDAFRKGAVGAVVTHSAKRIPHNDKVLILVKDSTKALQDIARFHRMQFKAPVICVTGSNGKTTVKDMIASILSAGHSVLKNEGTRNNHIGVPQTLLKLNKRHDFCVLELGMNHSGEIRILSGIARPSTAVITNIGPSHLEFLGGLDGVYRAKMEVVENLAAGGTLIINGDDPALRKARAGGVRILRYGMDARNDFRAGAVSLGVDGIRFALKNREFKLKLLGIHNVYNALAAISVSSRFKVDGDITRRVLAGFKAPEMRMKCRRMNGYTVINDAYNSNPMSMRAALETIRYYPARAKWVVSADMLELGKGGVDFHRKAGEEAASSGLEGLLTFGKLSKYTGLGARRFGMAADKVRHCSTHKEIAGILKKFVKKGDAVLIKGSRAMHMEKVVALLKERRKY